MMRINLIIGKKYIVWDAFEGQLVTGYLTGMGKAVVSASRQSWHTPITEIAYVFGDKVGSQPGSKHSRNVAVSGCFLVACLSDLELPKFTKYQPTEVE